MDDTENRLIQEPVPIGSDRLEGHICKYAEKSYMYKYDLGHILSMLMLKVVVILVKSSCTERERERGSCLLVVIAACGEGRGQEVVASVFPRHSIPYSYCI